MSVKVITRVVDHEEDMAVISKDNNLDVRTTVIRTDDLAIATRDAKVAALWKSADGLASSLLDSGRDHSRRGRVRN